MAQPFNYPVNYAVDTTFEGGLRAGPVYQGIYSNPASYTVNVLDGNSVYSSAGYLARGAGIYYSPINTYRFRPYCGTNGNIVAGAVVTDPGWLTLSGDDKASTLVRPGMRVPFGQILPPNSPYNLSDEAVYVSNAGSTTAPTPVFPIGAPNTNFLMMDVPRCPAIGLYAPTVDPEAPTAPIEITVFGFDLYNNPMEHTYTIYNDGTNPQCALNRPNGVTGWLYGVDSSEIKPFQKTKAFYGITGIYCSGVTGNYELYIMTSNTFGLPYAVQSYGQVIQMTIGQEFASSYDCMNPTYLFPGVDSDPENWGTFVIPEGEFGLIVDAPPESYNNYKTPHSQIVKNPSATAGKQNCMIIPSDWDQATSIGGDPNVTFIVNSTTAVVAADNITGGLVFVGAGEYRFIAADNSTPSATSGDTRGLILFADLENIKDDEGDIDNLTIMNWGRYLPVDGNNQIIFSAYIKGADEQVNQSNRGYQPEGFLPAPAPAETPGYTPTLTPADLYGLSPFYSGVAPE
jgi:hypothetical protein